MTRLFRLRLQNPKVCHLELLVFNSGQYLLFSFKDSIITESCLQASIGGRLASMEIFGFLYQQVDNLKIETAIP